MSDVPTPDDPLGIFDEFEPFRETIRGLVAMFRQDGFDEEQARELATAIVVKNLKG